jgi:hypothetical protein
MAMWDEPELTGSRTEVARGAPLLPAGRTRRRLKGYASDRRSVRPDTQGGREKAWGAEMADMCGVRDAGTPPTSSTDSGVIWVIKDHRALRAI